MFEEIVMQSSDNIEVAPLVNVNVTGTLTSDDVINLEISELSLNSLRSNSLAVAQTDYLNISAGIRDDMKLDLNP